MKRIFVPTRTPSEWQRLLAQPERHWKRGFSAMTAAACWESAGERLPLDIAKVLEESGEPGLRELQLLLALPEWKVSLAGGNRESATDVMALTRNRTGLVVIGVEAKVAEDFGPTLAKKQTKASASQIKRIAYLQEQLQLDVAPHGTIRYQLLHRTVSALVTARDFHAKTAVMLVHSFAPISRQREDFEAFCRGMRAEAASPDVFRLPNFDSPRLYLAWCAGDTRFLADDLPSLI